MTRSRLRRWTAVLALVIASVAAPVMAQETNTVTITGTFRSSDSGETTWSVAMYGTTYSHYGYISSSHYGSRSTDVRATSFDLRFSGPDADDFNRFASEQLAGGDVSLTLRNVYQEGVNWSTMELWITSPNATFFAGHESYANPGLFPSDADGYPVVTPEPFSFWNEEIYISGYSFFYPDGDGPNAEISGSLGSAPPPATLSIGDASVVEGNRRGSQLQFTVSRSGSGEGTVSVNYRTVAGTALAKSDYTAASGTLVFQPGVLSQTITITVKSDRTREPDETFTVELFNAVGGTVGDAVATGAILNDD